MARRARASDVPRHRLGTVEATSEPLRQLARAPSFTEKCAQGRRVDPDDQDRADFARVRSVAALGPERLPSCRELVAQATSRIPLLGDSREARKPAHPFARSELPRHPVKSASVSARARPATIPCLSTPSGGASQRCVRPMSATYIFKDEHPRFRATPSFVSTMNRPHRRTVPLAATARFGRRFAAPARNIIPARCLPRHDDRWCSRHRPDLASLVACAT